MNQVISMLLYSYYINIILCIMVFLQKKKNNNFRMFACNLNSLIHLILIKLIQINTFKIVLFKTYLMLIYTHTHNQQLLIVIYSHYRRIWPCRYRCSVYYHPEKQSTQSCNNLNSIEKIMATKNRSLTHTSVRAQSNGPLTNALFDLRAVHRVRRKCFKVIDHIFRSHTPVITEHWPYK